MHLKKGSLELKFDEEKLDGVLRHLYAANKSLKVGILEGAQTTSEGPSIAEIAYWNEYGTKSSKKKVHIPARPFFRNAISDNTDTWAESIKSQLKTMGITDKNVVEKVHKKNRSAYAFRYSAEYIKRRFCAKPPIHYKNERRQKHTTC